MQISDNGLEIIKESEGLRLKAYRDSKGIPTIGWGHTRGVKMGDTCTVEQAEAWLSQDVQSAEDDVLDAVRVPLNQNQFDALVSFVFNIGGPKFRSSTLLRQLNAGDYALAAKQFGRWVYADGKVLNGLVTRRERERLLFVG